ncbi:MAG: pilus assembly FimT family protein [Thermoguttaceae bacterium]
MRRAFTLIEVLLVLVIMLILAGAGLPLLRGSIAHYKLRSAADSFRAEIQHARINAMEEGQIFCLRGQVGGSEWIVDRLLDSHFTAGLSSRQTSQKFSIQNELDPFERGQFTGNSEDFILRDPESATPELGASRFSTPETITLVDVMALPDERTVFYLGQTNPGEKLAEENVSESESVTQQDCRIGETAGSSGLFWSTPIFLFPDGTASTAAILLKNERGQCIEVRIRGLTGQAIPCEMTTTELYSGELDSTR